ncbi:MAG: chorismate-binding protein [Micromonosporaceae bacterium]|nr:chorismate-binding protein [Micromonosporaceae bacterium]
MVTTVSDLNALASQVSGSPAGPVLALVPFRQVADNGYACHDDRTPLQMMRIVDRKRVALDELLSVLPADEVTLTGGGFDLDDQAYERLVRSVISDEIGSGAGSNFVLKRTYEAHVNGFSARTALAMYRRLLQHESGSYWTLLINTGNRVLLGATPERQVSVRDGVVTMNPISGTLRYPPGGIELDDVLAFLADGKETDELCMVLDEELKIMARVCEGGGRVIGPELREMAQVAHTGYDIVGTSTRPPAEVLRETLCAPTVVGSPVENAYRVIGRHERHGRGYYSGAIALFDRDAAGRPTMDSAILIRTAEIDTSGRLHLAVGATLVRHSDPAAEAAETAAKAAGFLRALRVDCRRPTVAPHDRRLSEHPLVRSALAARNDGLADFWLGLGRPRHDPVLLGRHALVLDAEDRFTAMLTQQLRGLGLAVTIRRCDEADIDDVRTTDLLVAGPGPGDPHADRDPRIASLLRTIRVRIEAGRPLLAICLSHQVLCRHLGLPLARRPVPNQGAQHAVDLFGTRARVGFYNTFVAVSTVDTMATGPYQVEIARDSATGEVYATRSALFASLQFHPESVLSPDGYPVLGDLLCDLLGGQAPS